MPATKQESSLSVRSHACRHAKACAAFWPVLMFVALGMGLSSHCAAQAISKPTSTALSDESPQLVSYDHGQLRIVAHNVSLATVLEAIEKQTGAKVEFPATGAGEPIYVESGPGPARDVIASLLNGSKFNYIILGASGSAEIVARIILTPRPGPQIQANAGAMQTASATPATEPEAYGVAFSTGEDDGQPEAQAPPPPAPAEAQPAENGEKTLGQKLDELQKQQMKQLDAQAQAAQADAPQQ